MAYYTVQNLAAHSGQALIDIGLTIQEAVAHLNTVRDTHGTMWLADRGMIKDRSMFADTHNGMSAVAANAYAAALVANDGSADATVARIGHTGNGSGFSDAPKPINPSSGKTTTGGEVKLFPETLARIEQGVQAASVAAQLARGMQIGRGVALLNGRIITAMDLRETAATRGDVGSVTLIQKVTSAGTTLLVEFDGTHVKDALDLEGLSTQDKVVFLGASVSVELTAMDGAISDIVGESLLRMCRTGCEFEGMLGNEIPVGNGPLKFVHQRAGVDLTLLQGNEELGYFELQTLVKKSLSLNIFLPGAAQADTGELELGVGLRIDYILAR
jgi:hypothetical protein